MPNQCECGSLYNEEGICTNCGLVDESEIHFGNEVYYPYDEERVTQYGDFKSHAVSDISVMTRVNPKETHDPNLKRALEWDSNYGWDVVRTEIVNSNLKKICYRLNLSPDFLDECYIFFKSIRDEVAFTGLKLEDVAASLIYVLIRLAGNQPYTLFDFKQLGYNTRRIYQYYVKFVKHFKLYKKIKQPNIKYFVVKFINSIIDDTPETYSLKRDLIIYVLNNFIGYVSRPEHFVHNFMDPCMYDAGNGLALIGAFTYLALKKFEHPTFKIKGVTQKLICKHCGCSEVTLREYIKKSGVVDKQREKDGT